MGSREAKYPRIVVPQIHRPTVSSATNMRPSAMHPRPAASTAAANPGHAGAWWAFGLPPGDSATFCQRPFPCIQVIAIVIAFSIATRSLCLCLQPITDCEEVAKSGITQNCPPRFEFTASCPTSADSLLSSIGITKPPPFASLSRLAASVHRGRNSLQRDQCKPRKT